MYLARRRHVSQKDVGGTGPMKREASEIINKKPMGAWENKEG